MTTTRNTGKRLIAVLLTLGLVLSFTISALAATITIIPNEYTTTGNGVGNRFNAYQIFAGGLEDGYNGGVDTAPDPNTGYQNPHANWLTNVVWGNGVTQTIENYKNLLTALMASAATLRDLGVTQTMLDVEPYQTAALTPASTLGQAITAALKASKYWDATNNTWVGDTDDGFGNPDEDIPATNKLTKLEWDQSASVIGQVLSDFTPRTTEATLGNNAALAEAFAKIVAKKNTTGGYMYLSGTKYESVWDSSANPPEGAWKIDTGDSNNGYYLIVDTYHEGNTNDGDAGDGKVTSDYLVGVFGDSTIYVKSTPPTVDKTIVGGETENGSGYEIGDVIKFQLSGTLPQNYGNYDEYFYQFVDTMSPGLTYLGIGPYSDVYQVYVTVPNEHGNFGTDQTNKYDVYVIERMFNSGNGYMLTVTLPGAQNPTTTLTVTFNDLKTLVGKKATGQNADGKYTTGDDVVSVPVTNGSGIYVEYNAMLNENSLDPTGVPNSVHLNFSNDPNSDQHGHTNEEYVYVYDFGIEIHKYDGSANPNTNLAGAGFALTKPALSGEGRLYAILDQNTPNGNYYPAGWVTEAYAETLVPTVEGKKDWSAPISGSSFDEDNPGVVELYENFVSTKNYYFAAMTTDDGNLNILGLDNDIQYYLKEVVVPAGYDAISDIPVTFTADYFTKAELAADAELDEEARVYPTDVKSGMLKDLTITYTVNGQNFEVKVAKNGWWLKADGTPTTVSTAHNPGTDAVQTDLLAHLNVPNFPKSWLPGTGGMGTTLFYIAGGLLLAGAVLYLVISSVKRKESQEL
ncbi:MAG: isopeptide-forming domain-containing fimbrial protein [Christensenellaceae bacterium]|nr:isopeptide-forming domain-containing fimbrial protein [Christensenellaceae bacterium]